MDVLAVGADGSLPADDLFKLFRAGDKRASKEIYEYYYRQIFFYALEMVGKYDAEDMVGIAMEKTWKRRATYESLEHLKNSLYRITKNACIDRLRRRRTEADAREELLHVLGTAEGAETAMEIELRWTQLMAQITDQVGKLSIEEQEILRLRFFEGKKISEIAEILNINVNRLSVIKSRLLKRIRNKLKGGDWNLFLLFCLLKDFL